MRGICLSGKQGLVNFFAVKVNEQVFYDRLRIGDICMSWHTNLTCLFIEGDFTYLVNAGGDFFNQSFCLFICLFIWKGLR